MPKCPFNCVFYLSPFISDCGEYSTEQEGNCLRFFALQTVSTNAMRIAFDKMMPAKFEDKIKEFKRHCKKHQKDKRIQEQLSIKYFVLIRNFLILSNIIVKNITVNVSREIFDYTLILYFVLKSIYNAIFYLIYKNTKFYFLAFISGHLKMSKSI